MSADLSDRKLKILSAVVNNYIKTGEPVSSKIICGMIDLSLSSATVRNELAELTELGFLEQPHTSAGRVPSYLGYRLHINRLMGRAILPDDVRNMIDSSLLGLRLGGPDRILKEACHILAGISNFAVISTNILMQGNYVRNIQLVPVSNYHAMVVLTTSSGVIKTQVFRCDFLLTDENLNLLVGALNDKFAGVLLDDITPAFIQTVAGSLGELAFLMSDVLSVILSLAEQASKTEIHLEGQANLLLVPEFNHQSVINVMRFFNCTDALRQLLLPVGRKKTKILFGRETRYEELSQSSLILTRYKINSECYGFIGILGPMRMNYAQLVADLEYIAKAMGTVMGDMLNLE